MWLMKDWAPAVINWLIWIFVSAFPGIFTLQHADSFWYCIQVRDLVWPLYLEKICISILKLTIIHSLLYIFFQLRILSGFHAFFRK